MGTFYSCAVILAVVGASTSVAAQDRRNVAEPVFPPTCIALSSPLRATASGPAIGETTADQDSESADETTTITDALNHCPSGQAVELTLGDHDGKDAFLINPIVFPNGVSLIIDGGVTVYASRDPQNYQDPATPTIVCGTVADYPVQGCKPLLTLNANNGIYGYGVLDGQGDKSLLSGANAGQAWWDLLQQKHDCKNSDAPSTPLPSDTVKSCQQAAPVMIATPNVADANSSNTTLYKVTLRNPQFHTVTLGGEGITVWGVKVQAPWIVPNSDGFDIHGTDVTIANSIVANGDQDIAIYATHYMTVDHVRAYSKGGIALLDSGGGVSNLLVRDFRMTGDVPSVVGTTVNGQTEAALKRKYGLQSYGQALPTSTNNIQGLQIITNSNGQSADFSSITFQSVCLQDVIVPIRLYPFNPTPNPGVSTTVNNIVFKDIHVASPTVQFPQQDGGIPTPGSPGIYVPDFTALPPSNYENFVTLDNVVFDDLPTGGPSLFIQAIGNVFTAKTNVYPALLNNLQAPYNPNPPTTANSYLSANTYTATAPVTDPTLAYPCPSAPWPFTTGELYAATGDHSSSPNLTSASVRTGSSITLNAVVQPIMSQTTEFMPDVYTAKPGLLAVASPRLNGAVEFYEGANLIGVGKLTANHTLAQLVVDHVERGSHTYTAVYPADAFYGALSFGSVTVEAN